MKKHKSVDRLSELPESLILCILSLLEMRDVVKTSLLSKRWKDLWTTTSSLHFNETEKNVVQTRNFINGVIQHWRGTKILRFRIKFGNNYDASLSGDVDNWVGFARERKVEELYLHLPYDVMTEQDPDLVVLPPQSIYSCWSITDLFLFGYSFEIVNVQWDRLKSLCLYGFCNSEELIDQVVCSTPELETLEVYIWGRQQKLSIRSSSLRTLVVVIVTQLDAYTSLSFGEESLAICAPSLERLKITGPPYRTCLLSDVSSLSNVTLDFHDVCDVRLGRTLKQILPAIQHVEKLTLSLYCFKTLGVMKDKYSFPNVKTLSCWGVPFEPYDIGEVVEYFPKVEKLFVDAFFGAWGYLFATNLSQRQKHDLGEKWLESEEANKQLKSRLMHLKTIEVIWYPNETLWIFRIIDFISKHATMLQNIVLKNEDEDEDHGVVKPSKSMILAAQTFQRTFPAIDLIFFPAHLITNSFACVSCTFLFITTFHFLIWLYYFTFSPQFLFIPQLFYLN